MDDWQGFPHRRKFPSAEPGGSLEELSDEDPRDIARSRLANGEGMEGGCSWMAAVPASRLEASSAAPAGEAPWEEGQDERCRQRSVYNVVLKMKEKNFPWPPADDVYYPREWERKEWASMWPQIEAKSDE